MNLTIHRAWCPGCAAYIDAEVDGVVVNGKIVLLAVCPECMADVALDGDQETKARAWLRTIMEPAKLMESERAE